MSARIPQAVLTEQLVERIAGRRVVGAVFTTFRFEPAFFEQEVLPALFDHPFHHVPAVRLAQLEEDLRPLAGAIAVYYDPRALIETSGGSAVLDVRRLPVQLRTGYFHPKNSFIVLHDPDTGVRSLLVVTASANLTQAGWWENVEAAHIEEIEAGGRSAMKNEAVRFLKWLRGRAGDVDDGSAVSPLIDFLGTITQHVHRSANGVLHPHFLASGRPNTPSVVDFIAAATGNDFVGANLEIISPYFDGADYCQPLEALVDRFRPRQIRVLIPEDSGGTTCRASLYAHVEDLGARWSRFPGSLVSGGSSSATKQTVHAKVYRLFTQHREIVLITSANLTRAGHHSAGNIETGVLVEVEPGRRRREFWLSPIEEAPPFAVPVTEDEGVEADRLPLLVRYDWASGQAEVRWDDAKPSPPLQVTAHGALIWNLSEMDAGEWITAAPDGARRLAGHLKSSSFLSVRAGDRRGVVLVMETGMAHRPSLALDLSPTDILHYWSLLTAEQRAAFIGQHPGRLAATAGGEHLVATLAAETAPPSMFDRFAGFFHGFAALERSVYAALEDDRWEEARFRVFGAKYDSLRTLVERVTAGHEGDLVDRYLLLLCAIQVVKRIRKDWPGFWASDSAGSAHLNGARKAADQLRVELVDRNGDDMAVFLDWYEKRFLRRAEVAA